VNSLNTNLANQFIKLTVFFLMFFVQVKVKAWDVDLTRRQKDLKTLRMPAQIVDTPQVEVKPENILSKVFEASEATQDIVILNTDKGFIPANIKVKKGNSYQIHIVNVNPKEKNVSFIMDAFSEHT
jgi:hypothetical protein